MIRNRIFIAVIIVISSWLFYNRWSMRPITHGPGVVAPEAPIQKKVLNKKPFYHKEYKITPFAIFSVEARVLSKERYRLGRSAKLVPVDLALGWGPMSDERVLKLISITQSNRFYYWYVKKYPIPRKEIIDNSANMHLIPANSSLRKKIKNVRKGAIVKFKGYLVKVEAKDGWRWNTSLRRTDSGQGACELVWVEEFDWF